MHRYEEVGNNAYLYDPDKLLGLGFVPAGEAYENRYPLMDGEMVLLVRIELPNILLIEVRDAFSNEEYTLYRNPRAKGEFIGTLKGEIQDVVDEIRLKAGTSGPIESPQERWIEEYCLNRYGEPWDCPFQDFSAKIFRRADNRKWYAAMMNVPKKKVGIEEEGEIPVLNVRGSQTMKDQYMEEGKIIPPYHMSKKYWVSILLDRGVENETIAAFLDYSREIAQKK